MTEHRVRIDIEGVVAIVSLDRADKMNAVDAAMFAALTDAAQSVASNRSIRAVVLRGEGENFCAGIDIAYMATTGPGIMEALKEPVAPSGANLFQQASCAWRDLAVPVIAALRGATFGAGFQIAMGADIRFAAPSTSMCIMETKWGLIPDMGITTTLRGILPPDKVKELAWTARKIPADEALALGLLSGVHEDVDVVAMALAEACARRSPDAVRRIKRLVNDAWLLSDGDALRLEAQLQGEVIGQPNQIEAVMANQQKRDPDFRD